MKQFCSAMAFALLLSGLIFGNGHFGLGAMSPIQIGEEESPVELGDVNWQRDLAAAQREAEKTGKPILLLFQEIPGCATCQNFGKNPLSHPLMVEAMEDLFVPVAIYNNKPGEDERILKEFNEPAWNNPVVRFIDARKQDVLVRKDGVWAQQALAARMVDALKASKREVPGYLEQLAASPKLETATFAMHCYWEGEAKLGTIPGVANTRSGWKDKLEVVQVEFDPAIVDYEKLVASAQSFECASKIYTHNDKQHSVAKSAVGDQAEMTTDKMRDAKQSDQTYYLRNSKYRHLPLTELQSTKINGVLFSKLSDVEKRKAVQGILSPRQNGMLSIIENVLAENPEALNDFVWPDDDDRLADYASLFKAALSKSFQGS